MSDRVLISLKIIIRFKFIHRNKAHVFIVKFEHACISWVGDIIKKVKKKDTKFLRTLLKSRIGFWSVNNFVLADYVV